MSVKVGIDVGGTFTDVCLFDEANNDIRVFKLPTTPWDQSEAIVQGIGTILQENGFSPEQVSYVAHGTTVATNAAIERTGSKTGLITTRGFRDLLELARQTRPSLYDLYQDKPATLISRRSRKEVKERIRYDGSVLEKIDTADVKKAIAELKQEGVESIAVCLLHSYINPAHERFIRDQIRELFPEAYVSISSDVLAEFREYERLCTTVLNSYLGPNVGRYVKNFRQNVKKMGIREDPYINQSNGGLMSIVSTVESPVRTALSGPSAGVAGATYVAQLSGFRNIISLDMGGTSTDVCLIEDGRPKVTTSKKLAGFPVKVPMTDVHAVGAGGGSIAWVDSGGALKVGPRSAGAYPGPAAYGRGGKEPTVTDANVVLHRLNPKYILGGRMKIDEQAAHRAIREKIADPLKMSVLDAARGIVAVVNSNMNRAIRVVSVERGYDPREFALLAFGGAGALHAVDLGKELGIKKVLVPGNPGILCAMGLLTSDIRSDYVKTRIMTAREENIGDIEAVFEDLKRSADQWLDKEKVAPANRAYRMQADMRYLGQNFELPIPVTRDHFDEDALVEVVGAFHAEHQRQYGYQNREARVQFVNYRLSALGNVSKIQIRERHERGEDPKDALVEIRKVYFDEAGGYVDCSAYLRDKVKPGCRIEGPAIVEQMDSTTVIPPGYRADVDRYSSIVIS